MFESKESKAGYALCLWANHIETGDLTLCAKDAEKTGEKVNALTRDQMEMVLELRKLSDGLLFGDLKIS